MARAIYLGARDSGELDESRVVVADPSPEQQAKYPNGVGSASAALDWLEACESEHGLEAGSGQVLLAVKPQIFPKVAEEIGERVGKGPERVFISLLAGTLSETIRESLCGNARVVRIMPNTPAQVRKGMAAIAVGAGASAGDEGLAAMLMGAVGGTVTIEESMMDSFTGLAGSGPAYVFYLAEAMTKAGEAVGFSPEEARRIAEAVVTGSARLLEEDGRSAAELRKAVTSPNGTTQAGTETLDAEGVMGAVTMAIEAARDRGAELAKG